MKVRTPQSPLPYHQVGQIPPHKATRTNSQTLAYVLCTDSFWHMIYILFLYIGTTIVWDSASAEWIYNGLLNQTPNRWYSAYDAACKVLSFEIFTFITIHVARGFYHTKHAVEVEEGSGNFYRKEEPDHVRRLMLMVIWINILVSVFYIFIQLHYADIRQRRHDSVAGYMSYTVAPTTTTTSTILTTRTTTTTTTAAIWSTATTTSMPSSRPARFISQL